MMKCGCEHFNNALAGDPFESRQQAAVFEIGYDLGNGLADRIFRPYSADRLQPGIPCLDHKVAVGGKDRRVGGRP